MKTYYRQQEEIGDIISMEEVAGSEVRRLQFMERIDRMAADALAEIDAMVAIAKVPLKIPSMSSLSLQDLFSQQNAFAGLGGINQQMLAQQQAMAPHPFAGGLLGGAFGRQY